MKAYQKVMLLLYPKLGRLAEDVRKIINALACACGGSEAAEQSVERVIGYLYVRRCFLAMKAELDEVISQLGREERYLLEYKYFRRRKVLAEEFADLRIDCSERTYFRRQNKLAEKFNALLLRRGLSEEWFRRTFSDVPYIMAALEKVETGGEKSFSDKRRRRSLRIASQAKSAARASAVRTKDAEHASAAASLRATAERAAVPAEKTQKKSSASSP